MSKVRDSLPPNSPESTSNVSDQFTSTVQSPQFQQALSTFSAALQSGQLGPLIQQFGLSHECVDAANSGGLIILILNHYFKILLFNSNLFYFL
jgi:hypothetical protein